MNFVVLWRGYLPYYIHLPTVGIYGYGYRYYYGAIHPYYGVANWLSMAMVPRSVRLFEYKPRWTKIQSLPLQSIN